MVGLPNPLPARATRSNTPVPGDGLP
jgi:hypothetical protein